MASAADTIPVSHVDDWAFAARHQDGSADLVVAAGWMVDATVAYAGDSITAVLQAKALVTAIGFDTDLGNNVSKLGVQSESVL